MMVVIIVLIAILLLYFLVISSDGKKSERDSDLLERSRPKSHTQKFRMAGITKRCDKSDIGPIMGIVKYEPSNPHDKNAIAIIDNLNGREEKTVGYISKEDQAAFRNFAYKDTALPFVGFIEEFQTDGGRMSI